MNIDGSTDPFYRYKRSRLELEVRRDRVIIKNAGKISRELNRDIGLISKYLNLLISTQISVKNETIEIKKILSEKELNDYLQIFIDNYVLCKKCNNPETIIGRRGNQIEMNCSACGLANSFAPKSKMDNIIFNNI